MPSFADESLLEPALAPVEPPIAPDDEPPAKPDKLPEPPAGEPLAPDDDAPDEPVEPIDEPEPDEPLAPPDDPPMPPVAPALLVPLTLEPVDGLVLDDEPPDRLPDEPALADEPGLLLFRLLDLSSLPRLD